MSHEQRSLERELADVVVCPLCFASFNSGRAYTAHFRKRNLTPGGRAVHECLARREFRRKGLEHNDETGTWGVLRRAC